MNIDKINRRLRKKYGASLSAQLKDGAIVVSGRLSKWSDTVDACYMAASKYGKIHVVNDIICGEVREVPMVAPKFKDKALDSKKPDALIIGGGISGVSIARELSKWKIDILLVEKEPDFALQTSGRNDGEIHPGVDLSKGSLKHYYVRKGNEMYERICSELDVPFERVGQYICFDKLWLKPFVALYCFWRKKRDGITDTRLISGRKLHSVEPKIGKNFKFAISNPSTGCVCPYGLTIAYAENAVANGVEISLNTAVTEMKTENGKIVSVETNRGTLYPKIVINAAGVFAEDIAEMAGDRFFSIHPRRGTNSILDKKTGAFMHSVASHIGLNFGKSHSKGGGVLHTVHGNLLMGPDAVETWEKENFETRPESIKTVFDKQTKTLPSVSQKDIITYFTGVRAPTFEEDFIIEKGRRTENIIHCAGIQSPGLTTAPAVAIDIEKMVCAELSKIKHIEKNEEYSPVRKGIPVLRKMSVAERDALIKQNPDYGVIVCRCEEVSRGEVLDALKSPVCVPTLDGIKKRVRPGMGRCQGGFCSPLVSQIIADFLGVPLSEVKKSSEDSFITFGRTK